MESVVISVKIGDQEYTVPFPRSFFTRFEKRYGQGAGEMLVRLLAQDCNRFQGIANYFGITRERVRQIYNRYVRSYLPNTKSDRERGKACTLVRVTRLHFPQKVRAVWHEARKHGIEVSAVNAVRTYKRDGRDRQTVYTRNSVLFLNGMLTSILSRRARQKGSSWYVQFIIHQDIRSYPRYILMCFLPDGEKRYFIFRQETLEKVAEKKNLSLYFVPANTDQLAGRMKRKKRTLRRRRIVPE